MTYPSIEDSLSAGNVDFAKLLGGSSSSESGSEAGTYSGSLSDMSSSLVSVAF